MNTVGIIQARMGSTRLPGKVLLPLAGRSVLWHVVRRVAACPLVSKVVVATSDRPQDDAVAAEARSAGALVFRGSEEDVLARYYNAARVYDGEVVVRVTADCPVFDPALLGEMLREWEQLGAGGRAPDYMSNTLARTFPRGLDAEIFTTAALERAYREARQPFEREHVTPYFYQHPERFRLVGYSQEADLSEHRWTLDTEQDYELLRRIFDALGSDSALFSTGAVLALLRKQPELALINRHVEQKGLHA